ncbi:MAG: aminomethyl-transferring glycine dehydrogenase subunit GcvPA [Terrimesophilobacter sp.]
MTPSFVHPYIPNSSPDAKSAMLAATGAESVDDFFVDVPDALRLRKVLELPSALVTEQELAEHVEGILSRNRPVRAGSSFLGAGTYRHYVPAVVDEIINRSEFLTAYAGEPYEDHGRFQALFEFQSLMAELLAMDVVTVPTYDGYQAAATALSMAGRATGRRRVVVVSDILPDKLSRVTDFVRLNLDLVMVPTANGTADCDAAAALIDEHTAAVWIETPSCTGALETQVAQLAGQTHAFGGLLVVGVDPVGLGVLAPPAQFGADIVCGDIQSLGLRAWFGGAHGGFIAVHDDPRLVMELPNRLFGLATTDVEGEYGFGDVAYERTSFAVREEGKEWVGTAAALWGIAAAVHLTLMGPQGMAELGETLLSRTAYAMRVLSAIDGCAISDSAVHLREFVLDVKDSGVTTAHIIDQLRRSGIEPGVAISDTQLLVCVTELNSQRDIDHLASEIAAAVGKDKA